MGINDDETAEVLGGAERCADCGDIPPADTAVRVDGQLYCSGCATVFCASCHLIHSVELACAVVRARVHALIVEPGETLDEQELADLDRPAFISSLRLRGISLEPQGDGWLAVATVGDGVPVHVEAEDTERLR